MTTIFLFKKILNFHEKYVHTAINYNLWCHYSNPLCLPYGTRDLEFDGAWFMMPLLKTYKNGFHAGLPDGIFLYQKFKFGEISWALEWKMFVYFLVIWHILLQFRHSMDILRSFATFSPFWYVLPRKIWQPWFHVECSTTYFRTRIKPDSKSTGNLPLRFSQK
jgi:hypothetical protein